LGKISFSRPLSSYAKFRSGLAAIIRSRSSFVRRAKLVGKKYLNVGCGPNTDGRYINLDYNWHPGIDLCWDITKGLPIDSESLTGIYTEHCLEHLPIGAIRAVLEEFRRVLRPGGSLRIIVPDGELYLTRYADIIRGDSREPLPYSEADARDGVYGPILSVNRIFREHGHQFIYDFDLLKKLLEGCGFADIKRERFQSGRDPVLQLDTKDRQGESLYLEASRI
jgi:predicted SAM-dependent methyltransferase